jgi:hypothetical protein
METQRSDPWTVMCGLHLNFAGSDQDIGFGQVLGTFRSVLHVLSKLMSLEF